MNDAKGHLLALGSAFFKLAAEAHIKGMGLAKTSARIEQLTALITDEEAAQVLELFVEEGVVRKVGDSYEPVADVEVGEVVDLAVTSSGGDA